MVLSLREAVTQPPRLLRQNLILRIGRLFLSHDPTKRTGYEDRQDFVGRALGCCRHIWRGEQFGVGVGNENGPAAPVADAAIGVTRP
jgi:hypothetical protein